MHRIRDIYASISIAVAFEVKILVIVACNRGFNIADGSNAPESESAWIVATDSG